MGTSERLQYTVVGDTVNLASRLENASKVLGVPIVLSREVVDAVDPRSLPAPVRVCDTIHVKGQDQAVEVLTFVPDTTSPPPGATS